jgi:hypothetical protein
VLAAALIAAIYLPADVPAYLERTLDMAPRDRRALWSAAEPAPVPGRDGWWPTMDSRPH